MIEFYIMSKDEFLKKVVNKENEEVVKESPETIEKQQENK